MNLWPPFTAVEEALWWGSLAAFCAWVVWHLGVPALPLAFAQCLMLISIRFRILSQMFPFIVGLSLSGYMCLNADEFALLINPSQR